MSAAEMRALTKHMGHEYNIHINHYSLQSNLLERSKVSRVLTALSTGRLHRFEENKELSDIIVDDNDMEDGMSVLANTQASVTTL